MALWDFSEAQGYIAQEDPIAARMVAQRIADAARKLLDNPQMGRAGHVPGTREWIVKRTPYLIVYRINGPTVEIVRVWHGRRDWQNEAG
ncbi:MAG: type II toxin-antitoxin system RelE/ParE family toxin [Solimonas sp.]